MPDWLCQSDVTASARGRIDTARRHPVWRDEGGGHTRRAVKHDREIVGISDVGIAVARTFCMKAFYRSEKPTAPS